jgi:hypothetical protein
MCDFKPGDEVVHVQTDGGELGAAYRLWLSIFNPECLGNIDDEGEVLVVQAVVPHPHIAGLFGLSFGDHGRYPHYAFRKVQRRDLIAWLTTTNTIEEPKRTPTKAPA